MSDRQKLYCTAAQVRRRYGGISEMGLWRWIHDGKIDFPKPDLIVNGRRFADANEPTIAADAKFFARRPDRTYRVRRMSRAEMEQLELASGGPLLPLGPDRAPFTVVKQVATGVRLRIFVPGPGDEDGSDASDELGAFLWERYADIFPGIRAREAAFRSALFGPGGPSTDGQPS